MTEFDYDCLQKKQIARSAWQRVGLRRTVTFPSDSLTPMELARLSGPCRVYRLGRPMKIGDFRALPRDLQRTYLQRLRQRGGSRRAVCQMLGITEQQLDQLQAQGGVDFDCPDDAAWQQFLTQEEQEV